MKSTVTAIPPSAGIMAMLLAGAAFAQDTNTAAQSGELEEIVVTGTFLRGIAPTTVQPIEISQVDIAATGALTTPQVLATIPQLGTFNSNPAVIGSNNVQRATNRVNLRNLPDAGGGSPTLQLLAGHRMVGNGIKQTSPDADFFPPSALERVEAVPDGGSSIYGADAVGGVVNFIPRKRFDGVQFDGRYGSADDYEQYDYGLTLGKDWGSGSAYVAYSHLDHDSIYGAERDYVKNITWVNGLGNEASCTGNVVIAGTRFITSGATLAPGRNFCDRSGLRSVYPTEDREGVFASVTQEVSEILTFDMHGYYMDRTNESDEGPRATSATLTSASPFFRPAPGAANPNAPQTVQFLFTPFGGIDTSDAEAWGVTPELTVSLPNDWQIRTLLNYGQSTTEVINLGGNTTFNAVALNTLAATGQFNPYDVTANSPTVLNSIGNWEIYGRAEQELSNARVVFDGPLLTLPGGAVRFAVGLEYLEEKYEARTGQTVPGTEVATLQLFTGDRSTKAAFTELSIPIVGDGNQVTAINSLTLSLSARYDDYSDFGDTTNPSVGIRFEPVDWIGFRGRWGTSFQAPSLADTSAADNSILVLPSTTIQNPFQPPTATQTIELNYSGGRPDIEPQEADIWSVGFDISPPIVPGLTLSASYYDIKYTGTVSLPPVFIPAQFFTQYTNLFVMSPTAQQVTDFINSGPNPAQTLARVIGNGGPSTVYALLDARRGNLGDAQVSGIDLQIYYARDMSFGSLFANLNGTYRLDNEESANAGAPLVSRVDFESRLRYNLAVGANIGEHLRAQASLLYSAGYDVTPTAANNFQSEISSYQTVNLFFTYDLLGTSLATKDLSFSLSVNNVADEDPPQYMGTYLNSGFGYAISGNTIGRLFQFGVNKKF